MEYWSVEKKDINPLGITPTLQHSKTPKLNGITVLFAAFLLLSRKPHGMME
jgi:hypothetical protein